MSSTVERDPVILTLPVIRQLRTNLSMLPVARRRTAFASDRRFASLREEDWEQSLMSVSPATVTEVMVPPSRTHPTDQNRNVGMIFLPVQCRMARAALGFGVRELAAAAKVSVDTVPAKKSY